jgi:hypothetical protein
MFCGNCGLQLASAPQPVGAPPRPTMEFGTRLPPGMAQPPPAYPPPTPPAKRSKLWIIIAIIVLLVVIGGGAAAGFLILHKGNTSTQQTPGATVDRHGLPANVPLPNGVTFKLQDSRQFTQAGLGTASIAQWLWTVDKPNDPATLSTYYQNQLPGKGWSGVKNSTGSNNSTQVLGCQNTQALLAQASLTYQANGNTITAPSGGSVLELDLVSSDNPVLIQAICTGAVSPTNQ